MRLALGDKSINTRAGVSQQVVINGVGDANLAVGGFSKGPRIEYRDAGGGV